MNDNLENMHVSSSSLAITEQPRQPTNLQNLLRYSIEAGQNENQTGAGLRSQPIDPESYRFLQNALKESMSGYIEEIKQALRTLKSIDDVGPEGDISRFEDALDIILDYIGNLDVAQDFYKIGGYSVINYLLSHSRAGIRWRAASILGEGMQNNQFCQLKALEENGLLEKLIHMADRDPDDTVRVKSLYAVSSIVRGIKEGLTEFIKFDGFSVIMRAMQSNEEKLIIKASFFLRAVCTSNPEVKDEMMSMGFVEQLVGLIVRSHEFERKTEFLLLALHALVLDHEAATNECKRPEFNFKCFLDSIVDKYGKDSAYAEAVECAHELRTLLKYESTPEN